MYTLLPLPVNIGKRINIVKKINNRTSNQIMSTYKKFTFQGSLTAAPGSAFAKHRRRQPPPDNVYTDDRRQIPTEARSKLHTLVLAPVTPRRQ
jgi:hypothetical protein